MNKEKKNKRKKEGSFEFDPGNTKRGSSMQIN
jgi:hypothetical protein